MATIVDFRRYKRDLADTRDFQSNEVRDFIKLKTSESVNWTTLKNMRPVPQWDEPHPREPGFYLDYIEPKKISRLVWELEAIYTVFKGGQVDPNPLARPADVTFNTSLVEQATLFDNKRRPIMNTAREFVTGVTQQIPLVEYTIVKNLPAGKDPDWVMTHGGAVNSDVVRLRGRAWAPKTLLLSGFSGGRTETENRTSYSEFTLTILADARTWTQEVWNRGTVRLEKTKTIVKIGQGRWTLKDVWRQVPILEGEEGSRTPVTEAVPLSLDAQPLVDTTQPGKPIDVSKLVTLKFDVQPELPFSQLPLA